MHFHLVGIVLILYSKIMHYEYLPKNKLNFMEKNVEKMH